MQSHLLSMLHLELLANAHHFRLLLAHHLRRLALELADELLLALPPDLPLAAPLLLLPRRHELRHLFLHPPALLVGLGYSVGLSLLLGLLVGLEVPEQVEVRAPLLVELVAEHPERRLVLGASVHQRPILYVQPPRHVRLRRRQAPLQVVTDLDKRRVELLRLALLGLGGSRERGVSVCGANGAGPARATAAAAAAA